MKNSITFFFIVFSLSSQGQDMLSELDKEDKPTTDYTSSTFKSTRLINGQTVQTKGKGALEFIFAHRFGAINGGWYELYGLDQAYVRVGLEYGITDRMGVGIGRNSVDKTWDSYVRYKLLRQSKGLVNMPFTITAFGIAAVRTSPKTQDATYAIEFEDRLSYVGQLLIARKVNTNLSLQLMPSFVHKNIVDKTIENNDQVALGFGGRLKVTRSIALTTEYYYRLDEPNANPYYNPIGFGIDIETGGHVFQLVMTNSRGLTERAFLTETAGDFWDGDIHLGFNITRTFQLKER